MATNYPGAVDSLTNPAASDPMNSPSHAGQHANANDAIEAIETELGTDPAGGSATVKARFDVIEANDWVTAARIAADAVGTSEIAANAVGASELADSAVDTAAIVDGAVTAAKFEQQVGNLLTANQASIETDTTGLSAAAECTIARITSAYVHGAACLAVTSTGAGFVQAGTDATRAAVTAGETYTSTFQAKAPTITSNAMVRVLWFNAAGELVSYADHNPKALSSSWQTWLFTEVAPAGAVSVVMRVTWTAAAASEVVHLDCLGIWKGAGGQWALPGTPITGLSEQASNGAVHLSGTGTPESVIAAPPGSTFLDTASTVDTKGWLRYVKATGTGSTGWVAGPEADTGWRNVAALLTADATTKFQTWNSIELRRVGEAVYFRFNATVGTGTAASQTVDVTPVTLPTGFQPAIFGALGVIAHTYASRLAVLTALSSKSQPYLNPIAAWGSVSAEGHVSWPTDQAWPSSLPGSAV